MGFADKDSKEYKNLVDIAARLEEIIKDTNLFLHPVEESAVENVKRSAVVDFAQKIEDMIANIKEILATHPEKRDLSDIKKKVQASLEEIKNLFMEFSKSGTLEEYATKLEEMIFNIKQILSSDSGVEKRDLTGLMKKLKRVVQIALEIKSFYNVAKDVYDLVVDIKGMFADEDSGEHKEILDVAKDIGKMIKDTVVLIPAIKNEIGKRGTSWDDVIVPEVASKVSR